MGVAAAIAAAMTLAPAVPSYAATFTVTTTNDSGAGSLRQALLDARAVAGEHTITFDIPGTGPHTITPASALPILGGGAATVSIDGCSQPGAVCGTDSPLSLQVRIDGPNAGFQLIKTSAPSFIRGLSITGAPSAMRGIRTAYNGTFHHGADDLTVEFNLIGLAPDGSMAGNEIGIRCRDLLTSSNGMANLRIAHNVISGNRVFGIACVNTFPFSAPGVYSGLVIEDNLIGLDPTGEAARPNGTGVSIGATVDAAIVDNVAANNNSHGISVSNGNVDLLVQNNTVFGNGGNGIAFAGGTGNSAFAGPVSVYGNAVSDNGGSGILASPRVARLDIGGVTGGQANTITGNGGNGITVGESSLDTSSGVRIRGNVIEGNGGLGIDLANDGVTENSAAAETPRTGPNLLLNRPVITFVQRGSTRVVGSYVGAADQTYTLDFYANAEADPSGYGEGEEWIGSGDVTTDGSGTASFDFTFAPTIATGAVVSATATDPGGNTSEFSADVTVGPIARDDIGSTSIDRAVTVRVLETDTPGDAPLAPESLRLIDPSTGAEMTTVTVDEQGTFTADPDGTVTFSPLPDFLGDVAPVQYVVWDTSGGRSNNATITVNVGFRPIVAADDDFAVMPSGGNAGNVLANDTLDGLPATGDRVTITMVDDDGVGAAIGSDGTLEVPGDLAPGVYAVGYRICETEYPENCSSATARVTVSAPATTAPSDPSGASATGLADAGVDPVPLLFVVALLMLAGIAMPAIGRAVPRRRRAASS